MNNSDIAVEHVDEVGGLYIRTIRLFKRGTYVPQHVHDYDHVTLCGSGSAYFYQDGALSAIVRAGSVVTIKKGMQHAFQSLEDNTTLSCIHSVASAESIKAMAL